MVREKVIHKLEEAQERAINMSKSLGDLAAHLLEKDSDEHMHEELNSIAGLLEMAGHDLRDLILIEEGKESSSKQNLQEMDKSSVAYRRANDLR